MSTIPLSIERGTRRIFASAVEWPGWSRSGHDEHEALEALIGYAPRYARVAKRFGFVAPSDVSALRVIERLAGDAATDFGTPAQRTKADASPVSDPELKTLVAWLRAGWTAFDAGARKARGKHLRVGPRGGGRTLEKIVDHVRDAELAYLAALGAPARDKAARADMGRVRRAIIDGLTASAHGEIPAKGPRGGIRWTARYFVRRDVWHILDHLWEIEDRSRGDR